MTLEDSFSFLEINVVRYGYDCIRCSHSTRVLLRSERYVLVLNVHRKQPRCLSVPYGRISLNNEKKGTIVACNSVDKSQGHYAEWK